ncbi:predicted protein [Naegleria gruberi]|uniref:Predicted protein n=1 Tax=Naegleria gruberi TaxID=5762 RepID=D2VU20_NAEGR|nr:uncharacterized protein NAEGRDRAFT_72509 [Naegleria gruberi]EFC39756.1 predicted protein [Naegleria gruberi]|eukprot:XP_002672500.1 predicted protein [Naegleria gruberi strain NEG-M]
MENNDSSFIESTQIWTVKDFEIPDDLKEGFLLPFRQDELDFQKSQEFLQYLSEPVKENTKITTKITSKKTITTTTIRNSNVADEDIVSSTDEEEEFGYTSDLEEELITSSMSEIEDSDDSTI